MQKANDDCFYFLTSSCAKGPACPYRHNPMVLTCNVMCPAWSRGNCSDIICSLRHSVVQRPAVSNGMTCFYEKSSIGCLKPDCTYVHIRPRPNVRNPSTFRPSTTNLVNKDAIKPTIISTSPSTTPQTINESIPAPQMNLPPVVETPPTPEIPKTETPPRRIAVPAKIEQSEGVIPNVIADSSEATTAQPRVVGNRNVVIAETTSVPNRTVVHRVVVPSNTTNSPKKTTNDTDSDIDLDDFIEQENDTKKTNSLIDISFPCSVPSITNRLFTSSKQQSPSTNSTKPIRLNRDRLPATKITIPNSISSPSNGETTSAGTGLSQDDDRRTSRIERFKKKKISPPRTVLNSSLSIPTRNVISSKRPAPEESINNSPPSKRHSSQQENNHYHNNNTTTIGDLCSPPPSNSRRSHERHHHRRRRSSSSSASSPSPPPPPRPSYSTPSTMNDSAWKREVDAFLAKTTQPRMLLPTPSMLPKPVPLLSLRPRFIPQQQHIPRYPPPPPQRSRQPSSVVIKRPLAPVITPPSKSIEPPPPNNHPSTPSPTSSKTTDDDENLLLELDESADVVDTCAFIDEALFETDHLLELM